MGKQTPISIFLADDHRMVLDGIRTIITNSLTCDIVGEASDGREALERIEELKPDVAVLDISMPTMTGIEIARQLKKCHPGIRIIMLSQYDDEEYVKELLGIGVDAYVLKENAGSELIKAIGEVVQGRKYLCPEVMTLVVSRMALRDSRKAGATSPTRFELLTGREVEILKLVAEGKTNREIGSLLFISDQTVKGHRSSIMKKLNMKNVTEITRFAIKKGLIEP